VTDLQCFERTTIPQLWRDEEVAELMRLRLIEGRSWDEIAVALGRTESGVKSKYKYETHSREVRTPSVPFVRESVPDSVLKEQARRVVAWGERTLTATLMGDPPPLYSSLRRSGID
jgi:hypothetical protein